MGALHMQPLHFICIFILHKLFTLHVHCIYMYTLHMHFKCVLYMCSLHTHFTNFSLTLDMNTIVLRLKVLRRQKGTPSKIADSFP